jgi:hypothetical protein
MTVKWSQDSSVVICRGWTTGVQFPARAMMGFFLFATMSRLALGSTQPPIQCVRGASTLWLKRPERGTDNSPPSSDEVKNVWRCTSTLRLHGVVLS